MPHDRPLDIFAITAPGLEPLCAAELSALGIQAAVSDGGVAWTGSIESVARANLWLRSASRVVVRVAEFKAKAFFELELHAKKIEWQRWLAPGSSVEFRVTCRKSKLYHSDAVAQRFGEAVRRNVKGVRIEEGGSDEDDGKSEKNGKSEKTGKSEKSGKRRSLPPLATLASGQAAALVMTSSGSPLAPPTTPSGQPQLFIVRFLHDVCTVSVDTSGALLHLRGYRQQLAKAPLRETLAAAVLLGAGWQGDAALVDPMCGSGTIPIEAARIARRIAPGRDRSFAFQQWPSVDEKILKSLVEKARADELSASPVPIAGSDRDQGAIAAARANAERASVAADIDFTVRPISALGPAEPPGLVVSNPPYGVRVGETDRLRNLYAQLGNVLRRDRAGWTLALLSADRTLEQQVRLPFDERFRTRNGGIPVRLVTALIGAEAVSPRAARRKG